MLRSSDPSVGSSLPGALLSSSRVSVNEVAPDDFVTREPTPKAESRRGWRRRRNRKGKS